MARTSGIYIRLLFSGLIITLLVACKHLPNRHEQQQVAENQTIPSATIKKEALDAQRRGEPEDVAAAASNLQIFLADTKPQLDWSPVRLKPAGLLFVRPDPLINRGDLMGIQSAAGEDDAGVLVLFLTEAGLAKLRSVTSSNPGKRLALVVGQELLAAPAYAAPIVQQQLAFKVGSQRDAQRAARAVAGADGLAK